MDAAYIETIPFYENISAKVHNKSKAGTIKSGFYTILPNPQHNNYIICISGTANKATENQKDKKQPEKLAVEFEFENKQDKNNLDAQFCRSSAHICHVKTATQDDFLFDLYCFAGAVEDFGEVEVLAEEENLKNLHKNNQEKIDKAFCDKLAKECTIELNGESYFIMQGSYEKSVQAESDDENESSETEADEPQVQGAFSILCEHNRKCYAIKIQQKNLSSTGTDKYFAVTGTASRKNIQPAGNFHLIKAKLTFSDRKKAASEYNRKKLEEITEKNGSYLKAWREYTGARGNKVLDQARKFGKCHYNNCVPTSNDSVKLYFDENIANKIKESSVEELMLFKNSEKEPIFLEDKKCTFIEYCEKKKDANKERNENAKRNEICCSIVEVKDNWIEIRLPNGKGMPSANEVPPKGFIVMSMKGEESQIERQQFAWETISTGNAGINSLGNILEGDFDFMPPTSKPPKTRITNRVREKIFKNPPTDRQLEAIDVALRTPEIALVQGPPGTGKTTVITAILEILNEAQDKRGASAGHVLATSYQHDAVENMIERIRVNALPTWKYGKRRDSVGNYNEHIDMWCREIEERVFAFNPNVHVSHEEETFHTYVAEYVHSPLPENKERVLEYITQLPVTEEIVSEARELLLKSGYSDSYNAPDLLSLLRKIRALRTTEKAFADDGLKRTEELYFALESRKWFAEHKEAEKFLMNLCMNGNADANQLSELAKLKLGLLEEFSVKPPYISANVDDAVVSVCTKAADFLEAQHCKKDKKEQIIANWIESLQNGKEAFSRAIKDCDFVYAATSQQSVGKDILEQKRAVEGGMSSYIGLYDTVIIDEAARATPPDLLIPMCKAVRQIILVGDHRQLPQLVDDDLCSDVYAKVQAEAKNNQLEQAGNNEEQLENIEETYENAFKLSLFELLFKKLKELEKKDGIKRTITLDKQFRTHPVLGRFCSRLFYEPFGEGYESPRPASDFVHNLPGLENKAAVWIDVPIECGKEERAGTSRKRECEADCIIERFMSFVQSQKSISKEKKLSYGIIAFYSAQRDLIQKKLGAYKSELKDVTYRVGTVDAFQGMEFDVVFLSIVRTDGSIDFLTPNRLCVSMSRQKKVLIAVGCKDFVTSKEARNQKIPALAEFFDLCAGKNDEGYGAVLTWKK